jgi:acetyl esterase/lipase
MSRVLNILALLASVIALLAAALIVLPAPAYNLWLIAVAASEWSLILVALAAFGILCGLLARALGGGRLLWRVSTLSGALAILIALYPVLSGWRMAHAQGVSLSLRQYFAFAENETADAANQSAEVGFKTYTFANVENRALQLDAYLPSDVVAGDGGAGVIVVHGGSWNAGERNDFPQWNHWLSREGFAVFDIDYRISPQPNWQTATGDVKCAVLWVKQHAAEFHISPDRLAVLGRSAGGHLALLAAYANDDDDDAALPASCSSANNVDAGAPMIAGVAKIPKDASVRAVAAFYAPTDLLWAYDNPANQRVLDGPAKIRNFVGGDPRASSEIQQRYQEASPVAHVSAQRTPPTLLVHGGHDQLVRRENMDRLEAKLKEAGVAHQTLFVPYAQHGFDYNFNGWGAQVVRPVLLKFLRENTKPR